MLACEVSIEVLGENFHAAYTEGDNSAVVATDTMKNFILRESLAYDGGTLEGLLEHLGRGFLATYPVMEAVRMTGREHRFDRLSAASCSRASAATTPSRWSSSTSDGIRDHRSGREDLRLLKVTGSSFTRFARDEYTTLPERVDRPLLIRMDVHWRYGDPERDHVDPWEVREQRRRHLRRLRQRVDPAPRARDGHADARRAGRSSPRSPSTAENHTRDPAGEDGDAQALHRPVPRAGPDHPDAGAR